MNEVGKAVTELVRTESKILKARETIHLESALEVEKPKLWTVSSDKPALYEMVTRVYKDGQLVDAKKDLFGYRYYNWTPDQGFSLMVNTSSSTVFHCTMIMER